MPQVCKKLGISEQTYYRWRKAALDAVHQVGLDHVTGVGLALAGRPQLRRLDVGAMSRLLHRRPRRIVRPAPGVLEVAGFHQRAIRLLPAGRRDVPPPRESGAGRAVDKRGARPSLTNLHYS